MPLRFPSNRSPAPDKSISNDNLIRATNAIMAEAVAGMHLSVVCGPESDNIRAFPKREILSHP